MSKLDDLHTLVRLLNEFELPVSPILEYAIKEKEAVLCADCNDVTGNDAVIEKYPTHDDVSKSISLTSAKEEFRNYLYKSKSERTAHNYLRYIEKPIRKYIKKVVDPDADSVYSFKTVTEIRECTFKLKSDNSFIADNSKWHNALTAALTSYIGFIESKENA